LYNAECDSLQPLSVREIISTIVKRERERQRQHAVSYKDIEASRHLTQQMNEGFRQLIANAKKKNQQPTMNKPGNDDVAAAADAQSAEDKVHVERLAEADNKECAEEEESGFSSPCTDEGLPQENSPNEEPSNFPTILQHDRLPSDDNPSSSSASPLLSRDATHSLFFTQPKIALTETIVHAMAPRDNMSTVGETPCGSTEKGDVLSISPHKRQKRDDFLSPEMPSGRTSSSRVNPYQKQQSQRHNNGAVFTDFKPRHNNQQRRQSPNHGGGTTRTSSSGTVTAPPIRPSIIGPWSCSVCTFYNQTKIGSLAKCQMCQTARTTASSAPSANVLVLSP
jgi:hypothetical protein